MENNILSRKCGTCAVDISSKKADAGYCSPKCYIKSRNAWRKEGLHEQECLHCKGTFIPKTRKKYCSIPCMYKAVEVRNKVVLENKDCVNCGESYKPSRSFQTYCSTKCRNMVRNMAMQSGVSISDINSIEHEPNEAGTKVLEPLVSDVIKPLCVLCGSSEASSETLLCEPCDKKNMS
jgi:hypothetical protein